MSLCSYLIRLKPATSSKLSWRPVFDLRSLTTKLQLGIFPLFLITNQVITKASSGTMVQVLVAIAMTVALL